MWKLLITQSFVEQCLYGVCLVYSRHQVIVLYCNDIFQFRDNIISGLIGLHVEYLHCQECN
jgi:hypothetical protein